MNACKAIELAMKDTLAKYAPVGGGVWLCAEQSQTKDADFEERVKAKRWLPQIRMIASPESADDSGWTFSQSLQIGIGTQADDDPFCQDRAEIYDAVRGVVDNLYFQTLDRSITPREEITYFEAQFAAYLTGGTIHVGGITLPGGATPDTNDDVQTIGVEMMFHWSQAR